MNAASISAFAALAGSVIGGLTSFATSWLTQKTQTRAGELASDKRRRQKLYRQFIDEASRLYANALEHDQAQAAELVGVYAMISRMRVFSSPQVVKAAESIVRKIVDTYLAPNKTFPELRDMLYHDAVDPLREFSEACRMEFQTVGFSHG